MLSELQKKTAQAIVNIFETGRPIGDYGSVTVMQGDTGHLTYGRSQTTLSSGNLALLLHAYCNAAGTFSEPLKPFLAAFDRRDIKLDVNEKVKSLLRLAGDDPVMRTVQDDFFDRIYWGPALKSADALGVGEPLSITVVYDSKIHGSFDRIRTMTDQQQGPVTQAGEKAWIRSYVFVRRGWLANHSNALLHKTVYRMDALMDLIDNSKWVLPLPLTVRSIVLNEDTFRPDREQPAVVSAEDESNRVLFYARPLMKGEDVKRLQKALGFADTEADGIFGQKTDAAVREFQKRNGLTVDGKVGPATWSALVG